MITPHYRLTPLHVLVLVSISSFQYASSLSLSLSRTFRHDDHHPITRRSLLGHSFATLLTATTIVATTVGGLAPPNALAAVNDAGNSEPKKKLKFQTLPSGVRVADILPGNGNSKDNNNVVTPNSKVNVHITGRLLGKNGWIFEDSQAAGEDPFRLDLGTGTVVPGLEEALVGMKQGGRRRVVVPSKVGYTTRDLEPIPRDFGNRQRLYTTVMNSVRMERERQALGADLAGVVVFDVELLRFRN